MSKFDEYKYSYKIGLTPISPKKINFLEDKLDTNLGVKEYITEKLEEFSLKSENSVYNAKIVDLSTVCITEKTISFTLYSMSELPILGRSIRLFSQLVLEKKYFENLLVKKKLFKTFIPAENKVDESKTYIVDVSCISDTQLVQGLVEILSMPEYSIKSDIRTAVEKMKVLAVESGLISNKSYKK